MIHCTNLTWRYTALKWIVHPNIKICLKYIILPRCRWVCFLIITDLEKLFWTVFVSKWCFICAYFSPDSDRRNYLKLKTSWLVFLQTQLSLYTKKTDRPESCGLLVDYCYVFISCLNSYSDGTHSLQRIHWWASDVRLHLSKIVQICFSEPSKLIDILDCLMVSTI